MQNGRGNACRPRKSGKKQAEEQMGAYTPRGRNSIKISATASHLALIELPQLPSILKG